MTKEKLRNKFFKECTNIPSGESLPKVCVTPHDLFEWFWKYLSSPPDDGGEKELRIQENVWPELKRQYLESHKQFNGMEIIKILEQAQETSKRKPYH